MDIGDNNYIDNVFVLYIEEKINVEIIANWKNLSCSACPNSII